MQGRVSLVVLAAVAMLILAAPARAAQTFRVTGVTDTDEPCQGTDCPSIRSAIIQASISDGVDTVSIPAGDYQLNSALQINNDVNIQGESAAATVVHGGPSYRVFEIQQGIATTISHLTMRDGSGVAANNHYGGNLTNYGGTVTLDHVRVTAGRANSGGGVANRSGTMTIQSSLLDHNVAPAEQAEGGDGGAILNFGGDSPGPATLVVRDSTIAFNTARTVGGVVEYGSTGDSTLLERVTVAYNDTGDRGGAAIAGTQIHLRGSIVAGNTSTNTPANCAGVVSDGGNAESGSDCGFELQNADLRIASDLAMNGGETATLALGQGSAAIDAGGSCFGRDQRDAARPDGAACDAGAFEADMTPPAAPVIGSSDGGALSGTAEPLSAIEILRDGAVVGTTTADSAGRWSYPISGTGTYSVRATDAAGNPSPLSAPVTIGTPAQQTPTPTPMPTPAPSATPVPQKSVAGTPSGTVLVRVPGGKFVPLDPSKPIPLGSTIDAKKGSVLIAAILKKGGKVEQARFSEGIFKVTQTAKTTDLTLTEALAKCPRAKASADAAAKKKPKSRKLWGEGSGSFRTRGQYSAATVRGTKWLVQDSCSGTLTRVAKGVVSVRDNVKGKTIVLRAGKSYLAKPKRR
jgi:Big-like domain-containing protein